jgi:hypothetical protein
MTRVLSDTGSASVEQLVALTVAILIAMLVSAAFYASMSARDSVVALADRLANGRDWPASWRRATWVTAVVVVTPVLVALWATFLYVLLVFLEPPDRLGEVAATSAAVVAATRILAYTAPGIAQELAKIVPLGFVVLLLAGTLQAGDATVPEGDIRFDIDVDHGILLPVLIALELVLRGASIGVRELRAPRGPDGVAGA